MIRITPYVKLGKYQFINPDFTSLVNKIDIETGWDSFTDTAKILVPKSINLEGSDHRRIPVINPSDGEALWKRGDTVEIGFDYYYNSTDYTRTIYFRGVITGMRPQRPLLIECEDAMWNLKQKIISKYSKLDTTLPEVLDEILPEGTIFQCEDLKFGNFRVPGRQTVTQVLEWLKKSYGMSSFINRDGRLIVGFPYLTELQAPIRTAGDPATEPVSGLAPDPVIIKYGANLIDDSSLSYVRKDDMLIQLKVIVIYDVSSKYHPNPASGNPVKEEYIFGDTDGALRVLHVFDMDEDSVKIFGEEKLKEFKYDGWTGRFTTFLVPKIHPGDTVRIIHEDIFDQKGTYWVKRVDRSYGMDGGRQVVELDRKVV